MTNIQAPGMKMQTIMKQYTANQSETYSPDRVLIGSLKFR